MGSGVALSLLETGDPPTQEEILRFEEVSYNLRTSNGTTRMTFRNRMPEVDELALKLMRRSYQTEAALIVQDRAASTCLTSMEWAERLLPFYPKIQFEASDAMLHLFKITLITGQTYIVEANGQPLQFIQPPFAVCLCPREPLRFPLNHLVVAQARRRYRALALPEDLSNPTNNDEYRIDKISCVHPEAMSLSKKDLRFSIQPRSVFDRSFGVDVLRTMNILNLAYFENETLIDSIQAAFQSVRPGGLWIVGRTHEEDRKNHVTFFERTEKQWQVLERIGNGSEIEQLVANNSTTVVDSR
jgi:hypothetical protein